MNNRMLALWAGLLLGSAAANAEVYKWTDQQGNIHYGDRHPEGIAAESMNVRTGSPGQPSRMAPPRDNQAAKDGEEERRSDEESESRQNTKNCDVARENLKVLTNNSRIQIAENDTRRYLTPDEIEKKKAELQTLLGTHCVE